MGKFKASLLRERYSDWHFNKLSRKSYAMDIDMLEIRKGEIVAITEVKRFDEPLTWLQQKIYPKIGQVLNVPILIIETNLVLNKFTVWNLNNTNKIQMDEKEFIKFMDDLNTDKVSSPFI